MQFAVLLFFLASILHCNALDNGVGVTPAMGWNTWNYFRCNINEDLIKEVADAIVSSGLRDAGYRYVNIDDCWQRARDPHTGEILVFQDKFPNGMKALGDYLHARGLKFGIYSDTGNHTCEGYPGSWGYESIDAKTYADWGVDYLKYDYCDMDKVREPPQVTYARMRDALNATGRPILYSLCNWGGGAPHTWGADIGNSWRTGRDLFSAWDLQSVHDMKLPSFMQSVLEIVDLQHAYHASARPGAFNDPDMLVVGLEGMYPYGIVQECPEHVVGCTSGMYVSREAWGLTGGLTLTEQRTHFSLWCIMASPLILGNDPRHMSKATVSILTAPEVVAVNQDPLGLQGRRVHTAGQLEVWRKDLRGGRVALLLFNRGPSAAHITADFARDAGDVAVQWAEEARPDDAEANKCQDGDKNCASWAAGGECDKNPGFMLGICKASCPKACPNAPPPGPLASALVRDLWEREDVGVFTGGYTARNIEPHGSRLITLFFVPRYTSFEDASKSAAAGYGPHLQNVARVQHKRSEVSSAGGSKIELSRATSIRASKMTSRSDDSASKHGVTGSQENDDSLLASGADFIRARWTELLVLAVFLAGPIVCCIAICQPFRAEIKQAKST